MTHEISQGEGEIQNLIYTEPTMTTSQTYGDNDFNTLIDEIDETYDIVKVLEMPYRIATFEFGTDSQNIWETPVALKQIALPGQALSKRKKDKFRNFAYAKFDIKLKFLISAPKTTSAIFWICYSPYENELKDRYKLLNRDPAGITQYPGVKLNLAESSSAELVIPFVDYREAYNILTDIENNVGVYVYLLTSLRNVTTSTGKIRMTVESALVNVSLTCPTPYTPIEGGLWYSQGFGESGRKGVISEVAGVVSSVAGALSGVPVIGNIAKPVNMISNLVGGVASLIGFSRPVNYDPISNYANIPGKSYAHSKAVDNSVLLALSQETELGSITNEFPSKKDEMDIEHILRTPGLFSQKIWRDGEVFNYSFIPFAINWKDTTDPGYEKIENCAYFEYLMSMFKFVRSDIVFTFEIAKTAFHAGKLEIFFSAGDTTVIDYDVEASTSYRVIWDISESNTLQFKIPYTYNRAFYDPNVRNYGTVTIREILPLQYNEGVEGNVDVLVWKHYENTKFMCPVFADLLRFDTQQTGSPNDGVTHAANGTVLVGSTEYTITGYQAENYNGGYNTRLTTNDGVFLIRMIDGYLITEFGVNYSNGNLQADQEGFSQNGQPFEPVDISSVSFTVLENVWMSQIRVEEEGNATNVTTLQSVQKSDMVLTQVGGETVVNLRYLTRSHRPTELNNLVAGEPLYLNFYGSNNLIETDMLTYFSYMYRMMRGGVRYKIFVNNTTGKLYSALADTIRPGLISHTTYNNLNPVHEIEIPYYNQNRRYILGLAEPRDVPQGASLVSTVDDTNTIITQAGSDDFSYGLRVGPPRLYRAKVSVKKSKPKSARALAF